MLWFKKKKIENKEATSDLIKEEEKIVIPDVSQLKSPTPEVEKIAEKVNKEVPKSPNYKLPPVSLISEQNNYIVSEEETRTNVDAIKKTLTAFNVKADVKKVKIGPRFTTYVIELAEGTRYNAISSLSKELGLALMTAEAEISPSNTDRNHVNVQVRNNNVSTVYLHDLIMSQVDNGEELQIPLGIDIPGNNVYIDICKLPHLLVGGTTGSGKSCFINSTIISILMKYKPDECKLILIDPKKVELSIYNGIPHLLTPVVTDPKKAALALERMVLEMNRRIDLFSETNTKDISSYNSYVSKYNRKNPDSKLQRMPYAVIIIDELCDLMLVAAKEVEDSILRLSQIGRLVGIHLIISTEKPSSDVISPLIKVNIPSRISFYLPSVNDSRTILDVSGVQNLGGKGDMLYKIKGEMNPLRVQGCYVSDKSIRNVINYACSKNNSIYDFEIETPGTSINKVDNGFDDPIYDDVVKFALQTGKISPSLIQRKFRLGYNRATRILDLLEERGIVGPQKGSAPRDVLVKLNSDD